MGTTAQAFYCTTVEQDFTAAGEVDIRALASTPVAANSTTIAAHPNAAGTTQITLDPYTTRSTTGDIRANAGWAINRLSGGGTVSTLDLADSGPAGITLTNAGGATPITSPSPGFNGAAQFSAVANSVLSAAVTNASVQAFDPRSGRVRTYEIRITTPAAFGPSPVALMGQWSGALTPDAADWLLNITSAGVLNINWVNSGGTGTSLNLGTLSPNTTYVIAAQFEASTITGFVNGAVAGTINNNIHPNASATDFRMNLGGNNPVGSYIGDEVRITNGARYSGAYTPATTPFSSDANTLALYHLDTTSTPAPGGDGMDSIAGARRVIPAGNWNIALNASIPAAALLGSLTLSVIIGIYRVSSAGARTLITSATGPTTLAGGLVVTTGVVGGNIAVPQITLEASETVHVGIISNMVQVAGLLGATVAATATYTVGNGASITVSSPGVRTLYDRIMADGYPTVIDSVSRIVTFPRNLTDTVTITDTLARSFTGSRSLSDTVSLTDTLTRVAIFPRALADTMPAADSLLRQFKANRTLADTVPITDTLTRNVMFKRALADNVPSTDTLTRRATYARPLLEKYRAGGGGTVINRFYRPTFIFDD